MCCEREYIKYLVGKNALCVIYSVNSARGFDSIIIQHCSDGDRVVKAFTAAVDMNGEWEIKELC